MHAKTLSSSSNPGCRWLAMSCNKISQTEYLMAVSPRAASSLPSHAVHTRQSCEVPFTLLFIPLAKALINGIPILIIARADLLPHVIISVSCIVYDCYYYFLTIRSVILFLPNESLLILNLKARIKPVDAPDCISVRCWCETCFLCNPCWSIRFSRPGISPSKVWKKWCW